MTLSARVRTPTLCERKRVLHILRNPHEWPADTIRQAQLDACNMIEALGGAWMGERDPACYRSDCLKRDSCLHAFDENGGGKES